MEVFHSAILRAFRATEPSEKASATHQLVRDWQHHKLPRPKQAPLNWPDRPGRPAQPELLAPNTMPKRRGSGIKGRVTLLHALAHIELNAIDLALDLLARFSHHPLPDLFVQDWMQVAADESKHFMMIEKRLRELGSYYGALPAHDGLWEAALKTKHDFAARLAVVPMVLEARGLDVTPPMIEKLQKSNDAESAALLTVIYEDEKKHVNAGVRWFHTVCRADNLDPETTFKTKLETYFRGALKPPFNIAAREEAGLPRHFYHNDQLEAANSGS